MTKQNKTTCPVCGSQFCKLRMSDFLRKDKKVKEFTSLDNVCVACGKRMTLVRPGKYQCDNAKCSSNKI